MAKTKVFRVFNNRIYFRCSECGAKRYMAVQRDLRRRSVRCHKCGHVTKCLLNRRYRPREIQRGKAQLIMANGQVMDVDLYDVSMNGIGFDAPYGAAHHLRVKQEIRLKCSWSSRLLSRGKFVIKSIEGRRIGAEKADRL